MGPKRSYRTHLGPLFSEGARLLWKAVEREPGGREGLTRRLGFARGMLSTWLYGDRQPGRKKAVDLSTVLKIPIGSWSLPPKEAFVLPAMHPPPATESAVGLAKAALRRAKKAS